MICQFEVQLQSDRRDRGTDDSVSSIIRFELSILPLSDSKESVRD